MCGGMEGLECVCVEVGGGAGECVKTNTANNHLCIPFSFPPLSFSLSSFPLSLLSFLLPSFPLLPSFIQSWDAFFRSTTAGAPPGHAYTPPSSLRPSSSLPITTTQADPSVIRDHLRVQALIRAYQIRGHNIGTV